MKAYWFFRCLKIFISGQCSHLDNVENKMHVCARESHLDRYHKCACGKEWTEVKCSS